MAKDLGTAGGKAPAPSTDPIVGGTPVTGFDHAPKGEKITFYTKPGIGGSNRGAH